MARSPKPPTNPDTAPRKPAPRSAANPATRPPGKPAAKPAGKPAKATAGDRIAKVLARAGVASRREAERMIELGQVAVNGKVIDSPALNIGPGDRVTIDGHPLPEAEPARLWLYHKPLGLVTSERDEKGRDTVFDNLPKGLPRVMSVGRLDLNSEGLLLLTNDGELKRRLELPSTGWLRKYRVRIKGNPTDADLEPLRKGITIEGEDFQPMTVILDRQQGANAWLTVGIREGRNREIRRAMEAVGLTVNRLIRISYGPFRLGELEAGNVEEVRPKVLREQLGQDGATDTGDEPVARTRTRSRTETPRPAPKPDRHATDLTAPPTSRRGAKIASARARAESGGKPAVSRTKSAARDDDRAASRSEAPTRSRSPRVRDTDDAPRKAASAPRAPRPGADGATKPRGAAPRARTGDADAPQGARQGAKSGAKPAGRAPRTTPAPREGTRPRDSAGPGKPRPGGGTRPRKP